jgi:hypothetical protein
MISIVKLSEFVQSLLNDNNESLTFKTFNVYQNLDQIFEEGSTVNFIPSIINSPNGNYLPKNDIRGERLSFSLQVLLPVEKLPNWYDFVNVFVWKLNGKVFYINNEYGNGDYLYKVGTTYFKVSTNEVVVPSGIIKTLKMICNTPTFGTISSENFEMQQQVAGYLPIDKTKEYIDVQIPISLRAINDFSIGDEVDVFVAIANNSLWISSTLTEWNLQPSENRYTFPIPVANVSELVDSLNSTHYKDTTYSVARAQLPDTTYVYAKNPAHPNYLTFYKIKQNDFTIKSSRIPLVEQAYGQNLAQTSIVQADTKYICTSYYEKNSFLHDLVADMTSGSNLNRIYMLKMQLIDRTIYERVILYDTSVVFPADEFAVIPLVFTKAMEL